ncbi:MAG: polymorphic toxin type 30 domain-containing protein [Candidatus Thiodiazotropha sp.]
MAGIQSSAGGLTSASSFSNYSDPGVAESQQSTDTEAQSLTTEQSLSGGLTTEERLKASQSPLEQFVSESTESVSEFASGAWQGIKSLDQEYALTQRGLGILKVLGGAGEAAVGAVGIVTPEPATTIGGGILFVHGADVASSGLKELWTGKPEETLTDQAVTEGAKMLGADEATAHQLGDGVDLSLSLGSCGVGIYHSLTRPVTAQLGPMTLKPKVVSESVDDLAKSELSTSPKTIMGVSDDAASSGRLEAQGMEKADGASDVSFTMRGGTVGPDKVFSTLDELNALKGSGKSVGDLSGISGAKVQEIVSNIPESASVRVLKPVEGKSQMGLEYKWVDENGITNRLRIHDPDPSHQGSNAANGWVARWQQKGGYYDPTTGGFAHKNAFNPKSPHYDPAAANNTHIPIQTPETWLINLMKITSGGD